jgi:predicted GNAT family acetyltransferase
MYKKISEIIMNKYDVAVRPSMVGEWHVTIEITDAEEETYINTIFVPEVNRGQGIAREIISLIEKETKTSGKTTVSLDAFPYSDNQGNTVETISRLVNWYKSLGYEMVNEFDYCVFLEESNSQLYGYEDIPRGLLTMYKDI